VGEPFPPRTACIITGKETNNVQYHSWLLRSNSQSRKKKVSINIGRRQGEENRKDKKVQASSMILLIEILAKIIDL